MHSIYCEYNKAGLRVSSALALGISALLAAWVLPKEAAEQEVMGRGQEPPIPIQVSAKGWQLCREQRVVRGGVQL